MPAIVGAVKVINIGSSSIFHIGDVYKIKPYTLAKTFAGGGSFNSGDGIRIHLENAQTNIMDDDYVDQNFTASK
ncbi:spore germination protein PA [Gracilibacillus ureilyticus]|uniref:Spore germination protein PA n=1 Tax=Gracilibacillus ureilyticus TaxID=531814 RepID=A0A1H9SN71_9BACI|nr:spore germination protein [Gracilibacillus ureilyticus]SER86185.1 spore germination protein PA [Gracilibacillus ureilyticus]